jgi:hypothetical protein
MDSALNTSQIIHSQWFEHEAIYSWSMFEHEAIYSWSMFEHEAINSWSMFEHISVNIRRYTIKKLKIKTSCQFKLASAFVTWAVYRNIPETLLWISPKMFKYQFTNVTCVIKILINDLHV